MTRPANFRGVWRYDLIARALYSEAAGIGRAMPDAVAVPSDADDVAELVRWAAAAQHPLVPRGSGSSMAGGAIGPGVIVDLSRMAHINEVDAARRLVQVGPGALRGAVNEQAKRAGLRFPVDPSSGAFCTVGGMAATNAAGAHTMHFGSTRRWVTALDCVFADGSHAWVRRGEPAPRKIGAVTRFLNDVAPDIRTAASRLAHRTLRKDSSGYALAAFAESGELVDLLVGSEGTLAMFVGVELSLAPMPNATCSLLAAFASLDRAVDGAAAARVAGSAACELLDKTFLDVAASASPIPVPAGTEAVLLIELEAASDTDAATAAASLERALKLAGATTTLVALDAAREAELWTLRHAASPILARLDPSLKSMQFIEDGCVPPERLADYVRGVRAVLAARGVRGVIFGHAGDANVHVNPLVDVRRPEWRAEVAAILTDVTALVAALGGSSSGEHGDGRLRTPLSVKTWPVLDRDLFARVKRAFDPAGILNPGVKVPLPDQRSLGEIKYDPTLTPLPPEARAAMDAIDGERAWSRYRLSAL
ncbi:MAG: FAD-binding oxidoreductase [Gemmatimonadota bacterium]|nr:FAD-binding oxidoreductase [Gemmatimonadota bacterium]